MSSAEITCSLMDETRLLADGGNLYESVTLAVLKNSKESEKDPHINALISNGTIYISVNSSLKIIKDKQFSDTCFDQHFDDNIIDTFCTWNWYLLVCLRNGSVQVIDCNNNYQCIFSESLKRVPANDSFFINSFADFGSFLIVTKTGQLYRLQFEHEFKIERIYEFNFRTEIASFQSPFLLVNGAKLAILDLESNNILYRNALSLKKVFAGFSMFFALDSDGTLQRICALSASIFPVNNHKIKDFNISCDSYQIQIFAVAEDEAQKFIKLMSYPDLAEVYSVKISNEIHLITPESVSDELLYVSKIGNENNVSELRFQIIEETEPLQRLVRLLKKRKFEDAERFCKLKNLDPTFVSRSKAQLIIDKLTCTTEDVDNLLKLLQGIEDDDFRLQSCIDVIDSCSCLEDVQKLLNYCCKLPVKKRYQVEKQLITIRHLKHRFDTFLSVNRNVGLLDDWLSFCDCDLIEQVICLLQKNQIEKAKIIYARLDETTREKLTEKNVSEILDVLRYINFAQYKPFLPVFMKITLSILPSTLTLFVKWTSNRVFYFEKGAKADFPDVAIDFTENIVELIRGNSGSDIQRQCVLHRDCLEKLVQLVTSLKVLKTLKDEYGIEISITEYLSGPQNFVRASLFVDIIPESFEEFLKGFLLKFMVENNMDPSAIFLEQIPKIMRCDERYWTKIIQSVLNCINSESVKQEAVKIILEMAKIPWNDTVRKVANDSLKYSNAAIKQLIENEPIQVVLRRPEYKIKERTVGNKKDLKFLARRVMYCNTSTMVEDVYTLCGSNPERKHIGNMLLISRFIEKDDAEKALELLDNNPPEEVLKCSKEIFLMIEHLIDSKSRLLDESREQYYTISDAIFRRLKQYSNDEVERQWYEQRLKKIHNCYNLQKFSKNITLEDVKPQTIHKTVDAIVEDICVGSESIEEKFNTCWKLSISASFDYHEILLKLLDKSEDYNDIIKAARIMYEEEASVDHLCLMAVLLLKYLGKTQFREFESFDNDESHYFTDFVSGINNEDVFCQGLSLARDLVAAAMCKAESDDYVACLEVKKWVDVGYFLTRDQENPTKKMLFGDIFDSTSVKPRLSTFSTVREIFETYCSYIELIENPKYKFLTNFNEIYIGEDEFFNRVKIFITDLEVMNSEGQHFTSLEIVNTLLGCMHQIPNSEISNILIEFAKKQCIPRMLDSIFSNNTIYESVIFSLLLFLERDEAFSILKLNIKKYKRYPKKFKSLSRIGLQLMKYYEQSGGKNDILNVLTTMEWWKKFEGHQLDYVHFFKIKAEERLQYLINFNLLDEKLAHQYCLDYNLDLKTCYKYFLKSVLLQWKPVYEIAIEDNQKVLFVKNNEDELLKKCRAIMSPMERTQILNIIAEVWDCVNPYYYEVFLTILDIRSSLDSNEDNIQKRTLLSFLKLYRRVSKPSQVEAEKWFTMFPDTQFLDELSSFRLPFISFLFTKQIFQIIRPELNLQTYKLWLRAVDILKPHLNVNEICSIVVKDSSNLLAQENSEDWTLYSKYEDLFGQIDECVMRISNLEIATSAVYHLLSHTPHGVDQVIAVKMCYKYAMKYKQQNIGCPEVEKAVTKIEKKYFMYCAMHILYSHHLAEQKYLNLVTQPLELIHALYSDERILKRVDLNCPNINKATEDLAELFELDIEKIRINLINSWLIDNLFTLDGFPVFTERSTINKSEAIDRSAYVCQAGNINYWRTHLLALGSDNERKNIHCRAPALRVFAMISDAETISEISAMTYDEFMSLVDKLTLVSNLQYLGITFDIESLDRHNKKDVLNRLVQRTGNTLSIKTMALFCLTYNIYDVKYWEFILDNLIKTSSFVEVRTYLNNLKNDKFYYRSFYINAWQALIDHYFTQWVDTSLLDLFLMIQSCPVLFSLNFENAFEKCMSMDKIEFAAVLLQYLDGNRRDEYIKKIRISNKDLVVSLNNLEQNGLWGIPYVKTILEM